MAYTPEQIAAALRKLTSGGTLTAEEKAMLGIGNTGGEVDPAAAAKAKAQQEGVQTALSYGISQALLKAYPELQEVYELFKAGSTGPALEKLYQTNYYQNLSPTVKARTKQKLEQPGVYLDSLDKYKVAARKRLVDAGIKISMTDFDKIAEDAYARGLDDNQFDEVLLFSGKITGYGGKILGDTSDLKAYAQSFAATGYFNDAYWSQKSRDLFAGTTTTEDIQAEIRDKAASAFPGYADQIKNGTSVDAIASAYKGAMANILERDADSITYDDPRLRQALQYIGADGKPAVKPLWQFEKELRATPEWEYTNNARDTIDSLSLKVMRDWGLA